MDEGSIKLDNLGPCGLDEIFFPYVSGSNKAIGNCYRLETNGKVGFSQVNDMCLNANAVGSRSSSFSARNPEYPLVIGALDFLVDKTQVKK